MSDVSRETPSYTPKVARQIAEKAAGKRKRVMHGGALCSGCYLEPPMKGQRYGKKCHAEIERTRRKRVVEENKRASKVITALGEQQPSKGKDNGQVTSAEKAEP